MVLVVAPHPLHEAEDLVGRPHRRRQLRHQLTGVAAAGDDVAVDENTAGKVVLEADGAVAELFDEVADQTMLHLELFVRPVSRLAEPDHGGFTGDVTEGVEVGQVGGGIGRPEGDRLLLDPCGDVGVDR